MKQKQFYQSSNANREFSLSPKVCSLPLPPQQAQVSSPPFTLTIVYSSPKRFPLPHLCPASVVACLAVAELPTVASPAMDVGVLLVLLIPPADPGVAPNRCPPAGRKPQPPPVR